MNTPSGWELTDAGKSHLRKLGVTGVAAAARAQTGLRSELPKITDVTTRAFVEEAIDCLEHELLRSAVVMSWLAAIDVLYHHVISTRLSDFDAEAKRCDAKWKVATNRDDLTRMKEAEFLDRIAAISIIGKNVKTDLVNCLNLRNGCGHPNSLKIGENAVAHHVEVLILNVFQVFT